MRAVMSLVCYLVGAVAVAVAAIAVDWRAGVAVIGAALLAAAWTLDR